MKTWVCLKSFVNDCRHAHNTQNNQFVMPLQYLKKQGRYEVDFLHAHKQQTVL